MKEVFKLDYKTEYGAKLTTNGRELLAACAATGMGLDLSRVAFGSGRTPVDVDLADVHALYEYVADGAIADRSHQKDRLYLAVQYANNMDKTLPAFSLAEFMIFAIHPETGDEIDFAYGTLGSYLQTVPAYDPSFPIAAFTFPLVVVVSDKVNVSVTAPAGLVTWDELNAKLANLIVVSDTPPAVGPAIWFCSDPKWRPGDNDPLYATALLGDPSGADDADVTSEIDNTVYPILNASVSEESGHIVATIEES